MVLVERSTADFSCPSRTGIGPTGTIFPLQHCVLKTVQCILTSGWRWNPFHKREKTHDHDEVTESPVNLTYTAEEPMVAYGDAR